VHPKWADLCAPMVGRHLCAQSGQASVRPSWAGLYAPMAGRHLCAHGGQASVRLKWASLCTPMLGKPLCAHGGHASVRPKWAGLCTPMLGRPLCAHGWPASVRTDLGSIAFGVHLCLAKRAVRAWWDYVPSASNIADGGSCEGVTDPIAAAAGISLRQVGFPMSFRDLIYTKPASWAAH